MSLLKMADSSSSTVRTIVVLALSRMGDIYQLYPAVLALREKSPGARIFLVIYREFAASMAPFMAIDGILTIDGSGLKKRVLSGEDPVSLYESFSHMVGAINDLSPDLLINLTPNRIGATLGYLVNAREKRGLSMTKDGYRTHLSPWILYLSTFVKNRLFNDLNLVDLFKHIAGAGFSKDEKRALRDLPDESHRQATELLRRKGIEGGAPIIAMATGASVEIKRWTGASFARVCQGLLSLLPNCRIVLLGAGEEDRVRNQAITGLLSGTSAGKVFDLTGETSVLTLSALLSRVDVLLSNDTGTMHVAALFGTPSVCLSFSQLFYPETAPALEGNIAVSSRRPCAPCSPSALCNNPVCREDLDPALVSSVIVARLRHARRPDAREWSALYRDLESLPATGRALVSLAKRDEFGEIHFVGVGETPADVGSVLRPVYRVLWRRVLSGESPGDPVSIDWPDHLSGEASELCGGLSELGALSREGGFLTGEGIGLSGEEWASRIESVDRAIRELGDRIAALSPLTTMFFLEKESIGIRDPFLWKALVEETRKTYQRLGERAAWLLSCSPPSECFSHASLLRGRVTGGPETLSV
ncbi:MAG: glycosyltransferase family 9 protein [Leptospirillum sp.]